ncbi:four helix bundle protein [bacterium]|nr:MAG: four helix bundle protein [bacterium]
MAQSKVYEKAFQFSIRIVNLYKFLISKKKEFVLSKQILKSGTSIGANLSEANGAISKAEFSAKVSIAFKEAKETEYWLQLLFETEYIDKTSFDSINRDCQEICKMLFSILKTTNRVRTK